MKLPPAVIIGGQASALGVVRSLAAAGVRSVVVDTKTRHPAMWSRWSQRIVIQQLYGPPLIRDLLALYKDIAVRPVLIVTEEKSVEPVSEFREVLSEKYYFKLPARSVVTALMNKALFYRFAERHGLPVPRTTIIEQEVDLHQLHDFKMPIVLKPADKRTVFLGNAERINRVNTLQEAKLIYLRMRKKAGNVVAQEWVDGPDTYIYFALFYCGDKERSIFFGRKIASDPPGLGSTAVCVSSPEASDMLRPVTEEFLDISEFRGFGSIEFKWDFAAGRFVIIEPTVGRPDLQEEIATLNGCNLPYVAYCNELGLTSPKHLLVKSSAWRESVQYKSKCSGLDPTLRVFDAIWRTNDPLPGIIFYARSALRFAINKVVNLAKTCSIYLGAH